MTKKIIHIDIETDSLKIDTAKLKFIGIMDDDKDVFERYQFPQEAEDIKNRIKDAQIISGFNIKAFDIPIIKNNFNDETMFDYKVIIDTYEISAPKSVKDYGKFNKNRLVQMGYKLKNFTLKNIIQVLKLDDEGTKGDIDYKIFQQDTWTAEEIEEITKYLKQDVLLVKKLFHWYKEQFQPLKKFLPEKDQENLLYIKSSLSVLAYNIICNKAGLTPDYTDATENKSKSFDGGHHIEPRWELVKGNIISIDFVSMYPHMILMGNLHSPIDTKDYGQGDLAFWNGDGYYDVKGLYDNKEQGKVELALKDIFLERLKAKREGDKPKDKSYKIIINSTFGLFGNETFKALYNKTTASDCTSMARTLLKKLAKTLEINGFIPLYGFTDSIYVLIPPHLNKKQLMFIVNHFIKDAISHVSFPMRDTFKMEIEEELKMIWFIAKNCYLYVTNDNEVKYKSTLLNTNTPKAVMKLFEEYIKPIIIQKLDIPFTKKEFETQTRLILEKNPELSAQEYKVTELSDYKVTTSLQYQISEKYGSGRHFLIPNKKGVGIGKDKHTKKKAGIRHCTIEEFQANNLKVNDIDLKHLLSHLKPFYERNESKAINMERQITIEQYGIQPN